MAENIGSPNPRERSQALRWVLELDSPKERRSALSPHAKSLLGIVRNSEEYLPNKLVTMRLLSDLAVDDLFPGTLAAVAQRLDDDDWRMRVAALEYLGTLDPALLQRAQEKIVLMCADPDEVDEVKQVATRVLGALDPEALDEILASEEAAAQQGGSVDGRADPEAKAKRLKALTEAIARRKALKEPKEAGSQTAAPGKEAPAPGRRLGRRLTRGASQVTKLTMEGSAAADAEAHGDEEAPAASPVKKYASGREAALAALAAAQAGEAPLASPARPAVAESAPLPSRGGLRITSRIPKLFSTKLKGTSKKGSEATGDAAEKARKEADKGAEAADDKARQELERVAAVE
jgi:hypothetical protein